ncbi:hypothetical protein [Aquimarina mytili]|uniref:Uncharacterized protein n=1 Tax=Aquimarina mytili TaxID=874423 RepID=A0A937A364_9FLAO|nr:hypothetical protein [Aquimarina mytili]MBL0684110.1 hypothetical protein [Aquimarina mytili]
MKHFGYNKKSKFITDVILALQIKLDEFMYNLVHQQPYEVIVYIWIHKLYIKGKSTDDATKLIYKAKNILLSNWKYNLSSV